MLRAFLFSCCLLMLFLLGCEAPLPQVDQSLVESLKAIREAYAPDQRTDRVSAEVKGDTLLGYTTVPAAYDSLARLTTAFPDLVNKVRLLPDGVVGKATCGIIKVAVANLRSKPGHSQELATQALMGTPIQVLDKNDGWCLVRTPDRYIAWLEPGAFVAMSPEEARNWLDGDNRIYVGGAGEVLAEPGSGTILSTIVSGGIVEYYPGQNNPGYTMVRLPDGVTGWLPQEELLWPPAWWRAETVDPENVLEAAAALAGRPYLWGGTSPNGMDCSGFTKMSYYLNGFVIPRDASQQVHAGEYVVLTEDFANLEAGDQLFFGRYREDGSEKITHTGFYLGEGRFLHAGADNGRIRENSLLPAEADFAEHRLQSLLRARRLSVGSAGVVPVREAFLTMLE